MRKIRVAINGFGRIGRPLFKRIISSHPLLEVVAINDLTDPQTLAHLLKYDSLYGKYREEVKVKGGLLFIGKEKKVKIFAEKDPAQLPWKELGIDIVLECTGHFRDYLGARKHITAGAKKVIISAPSKTPEKVPSFVLGVNEDKLNVRKYDVVDMGSCTTNCLGPVAKVLNEKFTILKGFMTTVHSYTNDQRILDLPHHDLRRARAAAVNIIPTTTGAAKTIGKVIPQLNGKLDGIALRVPTPVVSVLDFVALLKKKVSVQEVNKAFENAAKKSRLKGILSVSKEPLVSSDYRGNAFSAIVDAQLTRVIGNVVKVVAWYDNEYAYSGRLGEFAEYFGRKLRNL